MSHTGDWRLSGTGLRTRGIENRSAAAVLLKIYRTPASFRRRPESSQLASGYPCAAVQPASDRQRSTVSTALHQVATG